MLTKRTNILFNQELWEKMSKEAAAKKISVGQLVRSAVEEKYGKPAGFERRKIAVENIRKIRPHFKGKLDYKEMINYGRKI